MNIIRTLLAAYSFLLVLDAILSYFVNFNNENWRLKLKYICDLSCSPIRKKLEGFHLPIDISPLIVILTIEVFKFLW
jgi:uncharacterized protein YggT (Ycf19 family)